MLLVHFSIVDFLGEPVPFLRRQVGFVDRLDGFHRESFVGKAIEMLRRHRRRLCTDQTEERPIARGKVTADQK